MVQPKNRRFVMEDKLDEAIEGVSDSLTHISDLEYVQFDTTFDGAINSPGRMAWDSTNETVRLKLDQNVTLQVGQEHVIRVRNASSSTSISDRTVVMFDGASGNTIKVVPAVSDGSVQASYLVGITTEEIGPSDYGFATQLGFINQVDTSDWSVGDVLFVDPETPGGLTNTEPESPAWTVPVAVVTKEDASTGRLLVRAIGGGGGGTGGGSSVYVQDTAPTDVPDGTVWVRSTDMAPFVRYTDADSTQWVEMRKAELDETEQQSGLNIAINGDFCVNQRAYASGGSLSSGTYGFDRWKSGAAGSSMTFTSAPNGQQVTINSGGVFQQVVERANVPAGTYTLSWAGTATGRVYNSGSTAPAYAASPVTVTLDGSANVVLEFTASGGTKTLHKVKFEEGLLPTPFTRAGGGLYQNELLACNRYYVRWLLAMNGHIGTGAMINGNVGLCTVIVPTPMRAMPTVAFSSIGHFQALGSGQNNILTDMVIEPGSTHVNTRVPLTVTTSATISGSAAFTLGTYFGAPSDAWISFSAEL